MLHGHVMAVKPYSPGHIGAVASNFTDMRLSGAVKQKLVELMCEEIERIVGQCMDLTPRGIREHLGMNRPIYQRTAAYGHFGRKPENDGGFSWEKTDLVEALKKAV